MRRALHGDVGLGHDVELDGDGGAGAFAVERAARCTRAQRQQDYSSYGGGVIRMDKGAALFDGVSISGTEAQVRAGRVAMRVGADGRGRCGGGVGRRRRRLRLGCAQGGGGVVSMYDGEVTFKGGSITNSKAVGAHSA